ncbi:MAG: hypothetical protein JO159_06985 [Acidobacteria bacterium]|nr:hypothetical protein [Acidobacteriota bacterium]MBV9623208.1 hypothetical protein [Acidobacteriota bacterium]
MNRVLGILLLVVACAMPALTQLQRMTGEDEAKFNSYYSRWLEDRQMNNRDDMLSMEQRMQDLMSKYAIPPDTPYDQVASENRMAPRTYDRDDRSYAGQPQERLSPDDQKEFNKEYAKWQEAKARNDRDDIDKHARKLDTILARYNISPDTPFDAIATSSPYSRHYDYGQFQRRFSPEDQKKFDKAYEHWLNDRRKRDRDDIAKDEGRMQEIMTRYNIPRDVPYDALASATRGY